MNIVIVGPGAIGTLFAVLLSKTDNNIAILDKDPIRAKAISDKGLRVENCGKTTCVPIRITADPSKLKPADLICVCVKAYDTEMAVKHALPLVRNKTILVSLQNGLGNAEIASQYVAPSQIVCSVTAQGVTRITCGHVQHAGTGPTFVAPFSSSGTEQAHIFANVLSLCTQEVRYCDSYESMIWSKLLVNAAINPVTVIADVRNGEILQRPELRATAHAAAREGQTVAREQGIDLFYKDAAIEVDSVCKKTSNNVSSMLQDIRSGKKTEILSINAAILNAARQCQLSCPTNELLVQQIISREKSVVRNK
ncbi:MAG: 2-dehydropantoate 2-reductase [Lentisphaerae bacterium]|nr:2-dehydropantoate 2-reductase [Lentisphaerota bacterium]